MNTITLNTKASDGTELAVVTYTEADIFEFIKKADKVNDLTKSLDSATEKLRDLRANVRDFFSEGEWNDGETTVNKGDVNMLLSNIGSFPITSTYGGTFTIHGTFTVDAENAAEAEQMAEDELEVQFYAGDIAVDSIEVFDVEENN